MTTKKELTIEELRKQCFEAEKNFKKLNELLIQAEKEEKAAKQAKLAAEKEVRYKEVIDAYENFEELRSKFVDDYGQFTFETDSGLFSIRNFLFRG
jgi:DNA-binding SARP family transcriptional activator